jgi:hypothetical protein
MCGSLGWIRFFRRLEIFERFRMAIQFHECPHLLRSAAELAIEAGRLAR